MDKKLELQIIGIAEDDGGPVAGVDYSGVTDALFVEVRYPLLQFVLSAILNAKWSNPTRCSSNLSDAAVPS